MFRKLLLAMLFLPLLQAEEPAKKDYTMLESGGQALIVRSAAIGDPKAALSGWLLPDAAAAFAELTACVFDGDRSYELSDFFNTSIILAGAQREESGITAFYSPWQDAILLVRTEGKEIARRGAEFLFLTGETFRGETYQELRSVVTPEQEPLSVALWKAYAGTIARFTELFPVEGVPDLSALKKKADQGEEFQNIRLRAAARTLLAKKLMTEPYHVALANCLLSLRALQNGKEAVLKKLFGPEDPVGVIAGLGKVPEAIRQNIEPVYSLVSAEASLFGFLNPGAPRFVFLVSVDKDNRFTLEWFDLNESETLLKAWEAAK